MLTNQIKTLSVQQVLDGTDLYKIPIYQRNYAWGDKEITQLIQDIVDYITGDKTKHHYYIGSLVVYVRNEGKPTEFYETIDGQQRLTTLSILVAVIKNIYHNEVNLEWYKNINLEYFSRKKSSQSLQSVFNNEISSNQLVWNDEITDAYQLIIKRLKTVLEENNNISIERFSQYLLSNVTIIRVKVPEDTDLNHYFEIMNNRGEQLEKHEVLKSTLLEILNNIDEEGEREEASKAFHIIWEACSNMEKYVQYGFSVKERDKIFGREKWSDFTIRNFQELTKILDFEEGTKSEFDIDEIITSNHIFKPKEESEDSPERFNSIINFQNFLLQVLRVQEKANIPLDDKRLISIFENILKYKTTSEKIEFVENFGYNLLKMKFLFDKYIIKREFSGTDDNWSLKTLKWYASNTKKFSVSYVNSFGDESADAENKKILMLLSMFHTATPTMVYKHWLNGALNFLNGEEEISANKYIMILENLAKSFVFERFLNEEPKDYFEIIYGENNIMFSNLESVNFKYLTFSNLQNNLVFNYLDYLIWKDSDERKIKEFHYTFRSSVEHFYPQHPKAGNDTLPKNLLDSFGNLCLISNSKNATLNNYMPSAKVDHYKNSPIDSIKQYLMMEMYNETQKWDAISIEKHNEDMIDILKNQIY